MKRLILIGLAIACLGADWPQKGDTVYVSADMRANYGIGILTAGGDVSLPACAPLRVTNIKSDGRLDGVDDSGSKWPLGASVAPALHKDADSCRAAPRSRVAKTKWRMELVH